MEQVIRLLPDHIANQIAAGEVVQRPASVVKELLENATDAGATRIELVLKDAGKALIQVIDNGGGMSVQDARMAFERHATSKIREADDLFNIRTMGFRGEALASIAAVAQVELKTRLRDEELGTLLAIEGSEIKTQEPVMTAPGTCLSVKNLFFNVPARRNFLKSNPVETRHILAEFTRLALAQPGMEMLLEHNGTIVYSLEAGDQEQRIRDIFGKQVDGKLLEIGEDTPYIRIGGYVGKPDAARKSRGDQFFFVNRRFIKSHYLNHAIKTAYKDLLPEEKHPFYVVFLEIDPKHIDINIHPTKTEIKFDDERTVYSLLHSIVRKGLADLHQTPDMDFDDDGLAQIIRSTPPVADRSPTIETFRSKAQQGSLQGGSSSHSSRSSSNWEKLFSYPEFKPQDYSAPQAPEKVQRPFREEETIGMFSRREAQGEGFLVQLHSQFILSQSKEGLVIIDQNHAHQRILFEKLLKASKSAPLASQQLLFPKAVSFSALDFSYVKEIKEQLSHLGFDLKEYDAQTYMLHGVPAEIGDSRIEKLFDEFISELRETGSAEVREKVYEQMARSLAQKSALTSGKKLSAKEMRNMVDELFQCEEPGITPGGKPTFFTLDSSDILERFQRKT